LSEALAGLYLHVPFCARVCPYCDFAVQRDDPARRRRFTDALIAEIRFESHPPLPFDTIYFGGGTPSLLEPAEIERLLDAVRTSFYLAEDTRIFLEANPEDVTAERVRDWRRLGVATLSLGIQALDDEALAFLGRGHDVARARHAVELALGGGFATVSVDMMYGLPGQSADDWRSELDRALALGVDHLSCYQLTIEPRTRFGVLARSGELVELDRDLQGDLFLLAHRHLAAGGMPGYEASQFARTPEHRSRHNTKYWSHTPYLGLGPSAHSFHERRRWWNLRRTAAWEAEVAAGRLPIEDSELLDANALALEALMTGLRTYGGVDLERVRADFGVELLPRNRELVERLVERGLVSCDGARVSPTLDGLAVADGLARAFEIPERTTDGLGGSACAAGS
jgi:oxygen-independent coproporphyrinogen-3 oxidase